MTSRILALAAVVLVSCAFAAPVEAKKHTTITCEVSATTRLIDAGQTVTVTWRSSGSIITYGPGGVRIAPWGTMQVAPTETTIYKFKFVGIGGNEKCGVRVRVRGDEPAP